MDKTIYLTTALVCFFIYKLYNKLKAPSSLRHIPVISFLSLLKSHIIGRAHDEQYEKVYKPILDQFGHARLWLLGNWEIIISDSKQAQEVLKNSDIFLKCPEGEDPFPKSLLIGKFTGMNNIFFSDGQDWRRHRRAVNPAFKKNFETEIFGNCTLELIKKISDANQEPIMMHDLNKKLTLDFLGLGLFSYDFEALKKGDSSYYFKVYNELMSVFYNVMYLMFPMLEDWIPSRRYYHSKNDEFREFLMSIIRKRKNELEEGITKDDLLSLIIKASIEEKQESARLTDVEVTDNITSLFIAGHDSTANTLTATFYYLAKNQDIQEKARQEVLEVLGDNNTVVVPSPEQTKDMHYLNCVIKESMRILPTLSEMRRYCSKETVLSNGLTVPAGQYVRISSWGVHHNPNDFPEPETFNPDRFVEKHSKQDQAWIAFGSGSRMCAGLNFALIGQRVTIAMLLQKFNITLGPKHNNTSKPFVKSAIMLYPSNMELCFTPLH